MTPRSSPCTPAGKSAGATRHRSRRDSVQRLRAALALGAVAVLGACANVQAPRDAADAIASTPVPATWQAPLPHQGRTAELARWWAQFDDPLLATLVAAAEEASPTLAAAQSRIAQARAARKAAGAALLPTLDANASLVRGRQDFITPTGTLASAGVQAGWEIDLFGGARAGRDAAQARLEGAQAGWHEARVSVAAETAGNYVALRACEAQRVQTEADTASREETARLTNLTTRAGFQSPANDALARASAALARAQLAAQRAQCDIAVKALVALTAIDEPALRSQLGARTAVVPQPAELGVSAVPGEVLAQRPDVYGAARELIAASADVQQARAQRLPRITLGGSLTAGRFDGSGLSATGDLWSIGPLSVSLPIFDAGRRAANLDAARARYDEAAVSYRARLRGAVREVEEALVQLQSAASRRQDALIAAEGFDASYKATDARFRGGLASLFELEEARRSLAQARSQLIELERERVAAWITLYRALGGGWNATDARTADAPGRAAADSPLGAAQGVMTRASARATPPGHWSASTLARAGDAAGDPVREAASAAPFSAEAQVHASASAIASASTAGTATAVARAPDRSAPRTVPHARADAPRALPQVAEPTTQQEPSP